MSAGTLFYKILSERNFKKLRGKYLKLKHTIYPKLSEDSFRKILTERLRIKRGSVVFIHSALDNLNFDFPFYRILPILLDIVGPDGTLMFPCWHYTTTSLEYLKNEKSFFDIKRSPTVLGILPELARRQPNAFRSLHPTNSIVAIGRYAEEIVKDHALSILPCDENSPFYKIIKYDGIIIGLGVSTYNLSFVHCIEDVMKDKFPLKTRTDEIFETILKDEGGREFVMKVKAAHPGIKYRNIQEYIKKNIFSEICEDLHIGGAKYFRANAKTLFNKMEELAEKGTTIYYKSW